MADTREEILARLAVILDGLSATVLGETAAFSTRARNRGELTEIKRPGLVLLDGDETVDDRTPTRGRPPGTARLVTMTPEIAIVLGGREPQNNLIGEDLNAIRVTVVKAVSEDAQLLALVGTNGDLQYGGLVTDLGWNRSLQGIMVLTFLITYVFRISRI